MLNPQELLRKAILTVGDGSNGDFGGAGQAPLGVQQVAAFIRLLTAGQPMLNDVRTVTSSAPLWQESIIDFSQRVMRPGVEANRLGYTDRAEPNTGLVEIVTKLLRGEVPVSDEVFEDAAAQDLEPALEQLIADRVGNDIEELFINGDTSSADTYLAQFNGWLKTAQNEGNAFDGGDYGKDYQEIFRVLMELLPDRWITSIQQLGRFYVPKRLEIQYRDILAARGTPLGDMMLTNGGDLQYQGIKIVGVPNFKIVAGRSDILLAHSQNLYAGYQRRVRFEKFRDPREGVTSYVVTTRVGTAIAVPEAVSIATNVDVTI